MLALFKKRNKNVAVGAEEPAAEGDTGLSLGDFIEASPIAVVRLEGNRIAEYNQAFLTLTQHAYSDPSGDEFPALLSEEDRNSFTTLIEAARQCNASSNPISVTMPLSEENQIIVQLHATCMCVEGNEDGILILHLIDQTEQKNLEMRFAHSQKMQAVGQLAGGVAHDFNNLLTAMIGFCDLLLMRHPAGDPSFADIMQVKQNANRAANLVRQLLAFSRRQTLQPKMVDMTDVLAELSNLIRRLIGENIELNLVHGRDIGKVRADQGQLEQVIINLAVNARDAMKDGGGMLTIRSQNVSVDAENPLDKNMIAPFEDDKITPGEYVLVEVEDTGTGIPKNILENIFEPFFSTKEIGSGTGLGLSTVYGIVKQSEGYVYVRTKVNEGTAFCLFFKRYDDEESEATTAAEENHAADLTGKSTILLVEDETPVRIFAARALGNKGYDVIEAENAEIAIEKFATHADEIDVIITDVMMPGLTGPQMIDELIKKHPNYMDKIKVVFISGYAEDAFDDGRDFDFLPKPFTLKQLAAKVKEVVTG